MIEGTSNSTEPGKSARVRSMFAEIAPKYDLLNHLLSLGIDKRWRRFAARKVAAVLARPGAQALDLCCGTGDLLMELSSLAPSVGLDFCHPMLVRGLQKLSASGLPAAIVEGDALQTPFPERYFDAVTIAFGLRNLEDISGGLAEIHRLLKPGGRAAVLEFSKPAIPLLGPAFELYFGHLLPYIGNTISGSAFAYTYLHDSVRQFPEQNALASLMRRVGFSSVAYYNLSGGVAALHVGDRV
ncbi:MAG TPA: bifunctional demethylmenaquinone methyltransferase/2-methoxy-6-polyprenyl-1,4-benzoquinol methylase UbiE [Blastocatellia bacterium]|nr:bifunctional demethylmenaquinone methyltransferase/2-methoxy-6-polyprenyl-1,4-benzoquinol methylase UbiE [Blastocatellia bacterium]